MLKAILIVLLLPVVVWGQRDDLHTQKEKKAHSQEAILDLKERGAVVLRLQTNHRKIQLLEQTLMSDDITEHQRHRHQRMLDNTLRRRDLFNEALRYSFVETFDFCPVYVMYDTSSSQLRDGVRSGIFLNDKREIDPNITLDEEQVFVVNFKDKSAQFPYDVLRMQRLESKLADPFPYVVPIRASWLNDVNSRRAAGAVEALQNKLKRYHALVVQQKAKEAAKTTAQ